MVDTATMLREQIYSAVRAFTCATVAEAEAAATFDQPPPRSPIFRGTSRPFSESMQATMRKLADQHRAAVVSERPA